MSMAEDTRKRPDFSDQSNPASGNDPLAELARLIGQSDPFNDLSKRAPRKPFDSVRNDDRPAPEWLARPASSPEQDYDEPHAPRQAYGAEHDRAPEHPEYQTDYRAHVAPGGHADDRHYAEHDDYASEHEGAEQHGDDRYRVALPSGQYEGDGYYAEDGHLPPHGGDGIAAGGGRRGILTIAAVVGLAVIGTAGAFGYRAFTSGSSGPSSPPIIKADPTPAKTVPAAPPAPAATASADSKPFQDRIGAQASAERVVPREEQPVSLPIAPAAPRVTAPQPSAQAVAPLVSAPPPSSVNEPKRVKTIPIRNDNVADTGTISGPPAGSAPAASARAPASRQAGPSAMPIVPQPEPTAPPARTKTATRTPVVHAPAASGAYVVQVSAQRTEAEAHSSYQALQAKYPSVLGGRAANFRRVDLGDKGGVFYRAQVGSFATSEQAVAFCTELKNAGGQCIVQKN